MSGQSGDIALKSEPIGKNWDFDGITTVRVGNSLADDSLINQSSNQIMVGGVDEIRVFGEDKEVVEGMRKNGDTGVVEVETSDDIKQLNGSVLKKDFNGVAAQVEAEFGIDLGVKDNDGMLGFETVDSHVRCSARTEKKEDASDQEGNNVITLVVDLNMDHVAYGETKSNDMKGYEVAEINKDPSAPVFDDLINNAAVHLNNLEIGNRSSAIVEQGTCIKQVAYDDKGCKNFVAFEQDSHFEKEGEFRVSDLVWGKVRSHPWWPGQIYDPSAASRKALKHKKKDCFLIAYFGDQSFAWNDASLIKPFRMYFSQMEKQSNSDSFTHAVSCALKEISRRVEYELACSCLPKQVFSKIESQVIVNSGIRKESSVSVGGDSFLSATSFVPANLVYYLKELAEAPFDINDRLEFVAARAQLLAFNRWKGYGQLPSFNVLNGLLDDDDFRTFEKERDPNELMDYAPIATKVDGTGNSIIQDSPSRKHKHINITGDDVRLSKKMKCVSEKADKADKKNVFSSDKKNSAVDLIPTDSRVESGKSHVPLGTTKNTLLSEKLFKVGDRIRKVASQLSGSASIIRFGESTSPNVANKKEVNRSGSLAVSSSSSEKFPRVNMENEYHADEMLFDLSLVAGDPMKGGYNKLIPMIRFFSNFRNSICLENSNSGKIYKLTGEMSDRHTEKKSPDTDTGFEGIDSYSTNMIIQETSGKQVLYELGGEMEMPTVGTEASAFHASTRSYDLAEQSHVNLGQSHMNLEGHANEEREKYSPTAFILNFTDSESIPSEANLNEIFSRHGPLIESDTEVLKKSNRAKVVFKRRDDAETAFSSTGKFSIFGPSLISYRLHYSPSPRKPSTPGRKRKRKEVTSVKGKGH